MRTDPKYEVRIFERTPSGLEPKGVTYACETISYTQRLYAPGAFTLTIPLKKGAENYARELKKGRYVEIGRSFYGIIRSVEYEAAESGDIVTATGTDLLGLLGQRITIPPDFNAEAGGAGYDGVTGSSETVIKHFVRGNIESPASHPRRIPGFVIAPDLGRGNPDDRYLSRYDPLDEVVGRVAKDSKLGLSCAMDTDSGVITFDVYEGADRTATSERPVVLSADRQTVRSMRYSDSDAGMRDAFYATMAGAEYEGEALTLVYYREEDETQPPEGDARREMHMDISAEHPEAGREYDELKRLALVNAADYTRAQSFTCDINITRFAYGEDYRLGDTLTIQNLDWGITADAQLVEMAVSFSGNEDAYTATFGEQRPTMIQAIKKSVKLGG